MRGFSPFNFGSCKHLPLCARGDLNPHVPKDTGT